MLQQILLTTGGAISGGYDSDAEAFFVAAGITNTTQKDAVNQLVLDLKAASVWLKMQIIYPLIGGDAAKHSYNLKNPAAFQITWAGTITHNANGITGNGSTGYGNTGYNQNTHSLDDDEYLAFYSRTTLPSTNGYFIGVTSGSDATYLRKFTPSVSLFQSRIQATNNQQLAGSDTSGFISGNRIGTNVFVNIRGTQTTATGASDNNKCNLNYFICARNNGGSPNGYMNSNFAFFCISRGLTTTEDAAVFAAVVAYQTALGRDV